MKINEITELIIAATSIISIIFNILYIRLTGKTLKEMEVQRLDAEKPLLRIRWTNIKNSGGVTEWRLFLSNSGKGLASNIQLSIQIKDEWKKLDIPTLLAPQETSEIIEKLLRNVHYMIRLSCNDIYGRSFHTLSFIMDETADKDYLCTQFI